MHPLNKGLRLSVLNEDTITAQTKEIKVLVKAEEGVDFKDFDMKSLRFGSSSDVNYGKGCKAVKRIASGKDLIIVFDGRNNTIRKDEFTPKLLGKTKKENCCTAMPDCLTSIIIRHACRRHILWRMTSNWNWK